MPQIPVHHRPAAPQKQRRNRLVVGVAVALGVLFAANLLLVGVYHGHAYPRTTVGNISVDNMSFGQIEARLTAAGSIPSSLTLRHAEQTVAVPASRLGIQLDTHRTAQSLAATRSWLPLVALFTEHRVAVPVAVDNSTLQAEAATLAPTFHTGPVNAKVLLTGTTFATKPHSNGYDLDQAELASAILASLDQNTTVVTIPTTSVAPDFSTVQAQAIARKLQASLQTSISYTYKGASRKVSAADSAKWYAPAGDSYQVDDFAMRTYVAGVGIALGAHASNLTAAVTATKQALTSHTLLSFGLETYAATKTYHYCVDSRGVDPSNVSALKDKLVATYADLRGWSLDGQVLFQYATSDCDFTVWLTAPSQMTSFGAICDSYWSCEVNNNVIVNFDRWTGASDSWNAYGGSIDDYRVMLINHETGHMLGFRHDTCPGTGQPAPVMMQESINLQGCVFNIWPVAKELGVLRQELGL